MQTTEEWASKGAGGKFARVSRTRRRLPHLRVRSGPLPSSPSGGFPHYVGRAEALRGFGFFAVFAEVEMEDVPDGQWAPEACS